MATVEAGHFGVAVILTVRSMVSKFGLFVVEGEELLLTTLKSLSAADKESLENELQLLKDGDASDIDIVDAWKAKVVPDKIPSSSQVHKWQRSACALAGRALEGEGEHALHSGTAWRKTVASAARALQLSDELVAKIESHSLYTHLRYYVSSKAQEQASNSVEYQQAMHALATLVDDAEYDAKAVSRAREVGKVLFVSDKHGDDDDNESSNNDSGGEGASQAASVKGSLGTGTSLGMAKSSGKRKRGKAKKTRKSKSKAKAKTKTRTKFRPAKRSKTALGKAKARKLASRSSSWSSSSSSSSCVTLNSCSSTSSSSVSTGGSDDLAGLKAEARARKAQRGKTVPQADAAVAYMAKLGNEGEDRGFDPKRARNVAYARAYLKVKLGQVEPHPSPLAPKVGKKGVNYKSSEVCMFFALGALCFIGCGKFKKAFLKKMYVGAVSPRFVWERPPPESGGLRKLLRRMYGAHKEWVDAELGHAFVSWLLTDQSREASKSKTSTATCVEQPMETSGSDNEA